MHTHIWCGYKLFRCLLLLSLVDERSGVTFNSSEILYLQASNHQLTLSYQRTIRRRRQKLQQQQQQQNINTKAVLRFVCSFV